MTSIHTTMLNDVALMLYSIDMNRRHGTNFQRNSWPRPEDLRGYEAVAEEMSEQWANSVRQSYVDKARPLVDMMIARGYGPQHDAYVEGCKSGMTRRSPYPKPRI